MVYIHLFLLTTLKALPHVTISSTILSTFHRRRWNIVDIVDDDDGEMLRDLRLCDNSFRKRGNVTLT